MIDEIIKTPDGDRKWNEVCRALLMHDRMKKRQAELFAMRSVRSKKSWETRKANKK